jgi:transposase
MPRQVTAAVATLGIDIGKNVFQLIGQNERGAIALRLRLSRAQVQCGSPTCPHALLGMEACVGAHHLGHQTTALGHDVRLMAAKYVRPYSKGQKNDFRNAEAIAEAVQRPTMIFVAIKSVEQLDLQALHRVRERLVSQRTGVINQLRAFLLERGIAVRNGFRSLRAALPQILAMTDKLSSRMVHIIEALAADWRRLDQRIEVVSSQIEAVAEEDSAASGS